MLDKELERKVLAVCSGNAKHLINIDKKQKTLFTADLYPSFNPLEGIRDIVFGGYAEPGYGNSCKTDMVVLGNWNQCPIVPPDVLESVLPDWDPDTDPLVENVLSALDVEIEWEDEWEICGECCRLVRTAADCMSWRPYYWYLENEGAICHDCTEKSKDLQKCWIQQHNTETVDADYIPFDLEDHGWVRIETENENQHLYTEADLNEVLEKAIARGLSKYIVVRYPRQHGRIAYIDGSTFRKGSNRKCLRISIPE